MFYKIVLFFSFFFISFANYQSLFADPEEELIQLLTKKSLFQHKIQNGKDNPSDQVAALYQKIDKFYQDSVDRDENAKLRKVWKLMVTTPEEGFKQLLNGASRKHTHFQYLAGLHLTYANSNEGFEMLSFAAGKGHQLAFDFLYRSAIEEKNPYALFELGKAYTDRGDNTKAAFCLENSLSCPELNLNPVLTKGMIAFLKGDFASALDLYRQIQHPQEAYAYMFGNAAFIIQCLKLNLYTDAEQKTAGDNLITFAKNDKDVLNQLSENAKDSAVLTQLFVATVTKPVNRRKKRVGLRMTVSYGMGRDTAPPVKPEPGAQIDLKPKAFSTGHDKK